MLLFHTPTMLLHPSIVRTRQVCNHVSYLNFLEKPPVTWSFSVWQQVWRWISIPLCFGPIGLSLPAAAMWCLHFGIAQSWTVPFMRKESLQAQVGCRSISKRKLARLASNTRTRKERRIRVSSLNWEWNTVWQLLLSIALYSPLLQRNFACLGFMSRAKCTRAFRKHCESGTYWQWETWKQFFCCAAFWISLKSAYLQKGKKQSEYSHGFALIILCRGCSCSRMSQVNLR